MAYHRGPPTCGYSHVRTFETAQCWKMTLPQQMRLPGYLRPLSVDCSFPCLFAYSHLWAPQVPRSWTGLAWNGRCWLPAKQRWAGLLAKELLGGSAAVAAVSRGLPREAKRFLQVSQEPDISVPETKPAGSRGRDVQEQLPHPPIPPSVTLLITELYCPSFVVTLVLIQVVTCFFFFLLHNSIHICELLFQTISELKFFISL